MRKELKIANILDLKNKLILTIFCSYDSSATIRMKKLKNCLIESGYTKTRLVSDYPYPRKIKVKIMMNTFQERVYIGWRTQMRVFLFFYMTLIIQE
jgi:hypothetical protein